ncbi:MAG: Asp-tRNA(Asn)/Glu-tRNA(Gln) amidotransferase subunit GatB [Methylacidiphilales bacterium]|nr:Asp-tRNA(Asn)/Glu-tRNA(Gln) amidotransferase subunit GatB [Candidatus Methylacidiphilales bacterium]
MTTYDIVIGLEVHVQLNTKSKLFSGAANQFGNKSNHSVELVDLGLPGTLPIVNREAVSKAILFGLAVNATIQKNCYFERKNYFYPDLPKGYQISQNQNPIVLGGAINNVTLVRAHLEEDAGKLIHTPQHSEVDLNRAGAPLLEIVTEPVISSAKEASAFLTTLHSLVKDLGISDASMHEGQFRCDVNISLRKSAQDPLGTRVEIKNINSFKFVEEAIEVEYQRQYELLQNNKPVLQETRLYDSENFQTRAMRSKEMANDYRYFPDPDIPTFCIDSVWIDEIAQMLPQSQDQKYLILTSFQLNQDDVTYFIKSKESYDFLIKTMQSLPVSEAKLVVSVIRQEIARYSNQHQVSIQNQALQPNLVVLLVKAIQQKLLSNTEMREAIKQIYESTAGDPELQIKQAITNAKEKALSSKQIPIENLIEDLFISYPDQHAQLIAGKIKVVSFFVGKVMSLTKGALDPAIISDKISKHLPYDQNS